FFLSSRGRHTRRSRDWSSDVCSSDLPLLDGGGAAVDDPVLVRPGDPDRHPRGDGPIAHVLGVLGVPRWLVGEGEHDVGVVLVQHLLVAPRFGRWAVAAGAVLPRASVPWPLAAEGGIAGGTPVGRDLDVQPLDPIVPFELGCPPTGGDLVGAGGAAFDQDELVPVPTSGHVAGVRPPLVPAHLPRQVGGVERVADAVDVLVAFAATDEYSQFRKSLQGKSEKWIGGVWGFRNPPLGVFEFWDTPLTGFRKPPLGVFGFWDTPLTG